MNYELFNLNCHLINSAHKQGLIAYATLLTRELGYFENDLPIKEYLKTMRDEDLGASGWKAAAATAIVFQLTSALITDLQITIDRPFIFLIQDKPTGTILFLGRVLDPTE